MSIDILFRLAYLADLPKSTKEAIFVLNISEKENKVNDF
jgi:hypothetical protein